MSSLAESNESSNTAVGASRSRSLSSAESLEFIEPDPLQRAGHLGSHVILNTVGNAPGVEARGNDPRSDDVSEADMSNEDGEDDEGQDTHESGAKDQDSGNTTKQIVLPQECHVLTNGEATVTTLSGFDLATTRSGQSPASDSSSSTESETESKSVSTSSSDSSSSDNSTSSSSSSSGTDKSSTASRHSSSPEIIKKNGSIIHTDIPVPAVSQNAMTNTVPFNGTEATKKRNERKKRIRLMKRLKAAGQLPQNAGLAAVNQYLADRGEHIQARSVEPAGSLEAETPVVTSVHTKLITSDKPGDQAFVPPEHPEPGWQSRLIIKEVECEVNPYEIRLHHVEQYFEPNRGRKRRRIIDSEEGSDGIRMFDSAKDPKRRNIDNGPTLVSEPGISSESPPFGEETYELEDELPELTPQILSLAKPLNWGSTDVGKGCIIAFKLFEMDNYSPTVSDYKVALLLGIKEDVVSLRLAYRDRSEKQYDEEGNVLRGKFELDDGKDETEDDGKLVASTSELLEPLLLGSLVWQT